MPVKVNDKVRVHYTGTLDDGSVFDSSFDAEPLEFVVGSGQMIPGFDKAVQGMEIDQEKNVIIKSVDAYGSWDEALLREFPNSSLPPDFKPQLGMVIALTDDAGRRLPATISNISDEGITLDLNHPLAGKDLNFLIKVLSIN